MAKGDRPVKIKRYGDIREKNIKRAGKAKKNFRLFSFAFGAFRHRLFGHKGDFGNS